MRTPIIAVALAVLAASGEVQAAPAPAPANAPGRVKGPPLTPSVVAAQTAVAECARRGFKVSALMVDSAGDIVVLLSGEGVGVRTQTFAANKAAATLRYKVWSGEVLARTLTDPAFDAEVRADPKIVMARRGGVPILENGVMIGAMAASGAPPGADDEECVVAGLDKAGLRYR
jgi:uncharacterized protein GlcG (DUF336 family)